MDRAKAGHLAPVMSTGLSPLVIIEVKQGNKNLWIGNAKVNMLDTNERRTNK